MEKIIEYLPILIPVILINMGLALTALVHVLKHPHYKFGNKLIWIVVVLFIQMIGPMSYFIFGRGDE